MEHAATRITRNSMVALTAKVSELIVGGETGYLIPSGNIESFSRALSKLINDRDMRTRFGAEAGQRVRNNFSIDRYVSGVEKVFDEVLRSAEHE